MQGKNCAMGPQQCADYYSCQFTSFVADLQSRFAEPWAGSSEAGFSFLFVQLPAYVQDLPSMTFGGRNDSSLPMIRLSQTAALTLPRVGMAVTIDHGFVEGHYGSIHSMDKTPVGQRLLLAARQHAYGENITSSGPTLRSATLQKSRGRNGTSIRVDFVPETVGAAGLLLRTEGPVRQRCAAGRNQTRVIKVHPTTPVPASQCGPPFGFELRAGGAWLPLGAPRLSGDKRSIILSVPTELAAASDLQLRYLWSDWPVVTVYSGESLDGVNSELPAQPFIADVAASTESARDDGVPLSFARTLGDEMVLQAAPKSSIVWGPLGDSASSVTVSWHSHAAPSSDAASVTARTLEWLGLKIWQAKLPPIPASFDKYVITATPDQGPSASIDNVSFGEVWLCSGQVSAWMCLATSFSA